MTLYMAISVAHGGPPAASITPESRSPPDAGVRRNCSVLPAHWSLIGAIISPWLSSPAEVIAKHPVGNSTK
jgi:hypothetical protein